MPELPEVERAAAVARRVAAGRSITSLTLRHAALRRRLPRQAVRSLAGDTVLSVERRGKVQRFRLTSGRVLEVHFRMTGDWIVLTGKEALPRHARAVLAFDSGARLVLDDPRALAVVALCDVDHPDAVPLGPDPTRPGFTARRLAHSLTPRRAPIKLALLDQRVVAGLGNIYVAESLWRAGIDPRTTANRIGLTRLSRLVRAIGVVLTRALRGTGRSQRAEPLAVRFDVYGREGLPCRRCRTPVRRIVQGGRSTYYCRRCQR